MANRTFDGKDLNLEEGQSWGIGLFCFPDTQEWRSVIKGHFSALGSPFYYRNCQYREIADIGVLINESLNMNCLDVLEEIRDCLCQIATSTGGIGLDIGGAETVNETACFRAKSAVSMAYFWAKQLATFKSGVLVAASPLFDSSSPLALLDSLLADGWAKDAAGELIEGLTALFVSAPLDFFGVSIPYFEMRDDTDYRGLMELIEDNQSDLIQSIYEACDAQEAKTAFDAAVDSLGTTDWKEDYLKTIVSLGYLEKSFEGSLSKLYQISGVGEWISYDCVGAWPCDECVVVDGPVIGNGFTNWNGVSWDGGTAVVSSDQYGEDNGPYLPYLIKFDMDGGGVATISNLVGDNELQITSYNQDCDIVSDALWDGAGSYTTPACSKVYIRDTNYPYNSYSVNLVVSV
jgi:hypothetical protein